MWHGYLLSGSGSNVYTANIARSWRQAGHDVVVMCQEQHPETLGFIDEVDGRSVRAAPAAGRCRLIRPDIGRVLPLYVYDAYEGFEAKLFVDLSEEELRDYTRRNVTALAASIRSFEPDLILTGHEVMGPYIGKLACEAAHARFIANLHGSALEYAVKKQERYLRYASEGLAAASAVVGGSRYMIREASSYVPGWEHKAVVVNPGCDIETFRPVERVRNTRTAGFVGKLIASKGVHHFIASLPLTSEVEKAVIVGYGGIESELRGLAEALASGDLAAMRSIAARGDGVVLRHLSDFLAEPPPHYLEEGRKLSISFTGRLEHGPLSRLLPTFDVLAVPSIVPEAFGMVAAEAAACGVLPVVPAHSGIGEAGAAIERAIGRPGSLTFDPGDPIVSLAAAIDRVLEIELDQRSSFERSAVRLARERWSWDHVATSLLALAP